MQLEPGSRNRLEEDWEPIIDYAPAASKERKKPENRLLLPKMGKLSARTMFVLTHSRKGRFKGTKIRWQGTVFRGDSILFALEGYSIEFGACI